MQDFGAKFGVDVFSAFYSILDLLIPFMLLVSVKYIRSWLHTCNMELFSLENIHCQYTVV